MNILGSSSSSWPSTLYSGSQSSSEKSPPLPYQEAPHPYPGASPAILQLVEVTESSSDIEVHLPTITFVRKLRQVDTVSELERELKIPRELNDSDFDGGLVLLVPPGFKHLLTLADDPADPPGCWGLFKNNCWAGTFRRDDRRSHFSVANMVISPVTQALGVMLLSGVGTTGTSQVFLGTVGLFGGVVASAISSGLIVTGLAAYYAANESEVGSFPALDNNQGTCCVGTFMFAGAFVGGLSGAMLPATAWASTGLCLGGGVAGMIGFCHAELVLEECICSMCCTPRNLPAIDREQFEENRPAREGVQFQTVFLQPVDPYAGPVPQRMLA